MVVACYTHLHMLSINLSVWSLALSRSLSCVCLSGNIDCATLGRVIDRGLAASGRYLSLSLSLHVASMCFVSLFVSLLSFRSGDVSLV